MVRISYTVFSFKKTFKNHKNHSVFRIQLFLDVFLKLNNINEIMTSYRQLTRQCSLDRHPYWVFYDKVEFWLFNGLVRFWGPNPVRLKDEFYFETSGIFHSYLNTNNCKGWELSAHFYIFWPTLWAYTKEKTIQNVEILRESSWW